MTRGRPRWSRSRSSKPLLDDELALHPRSPVSVDGAVERVRPRLEVERLARAPARDRVRALVLDARAVERDVVLNRGVVREVDRHLARAGVELRLVERKGAARIGGQ